MISGGNQFDMRDRGVYASQMYADDPWAESLPACYIPKPVRELDEEYLAFVRSLSCAKCNASGPSVSHHHPLAGHSAMGSKTSDYRTVPLCVRCHDEVHQHGKISFWFNLDTVEVLISKLNIQFFFLAPP